MSSLCSPLSHFFSSSLFSFFFFNDTATTEIYTLSLHDALPIWRTCGPSTSRSAWWSRCVAVCSCVVRSLWSDRKSTRLNSSHVEISYAVFCLKKKISSMRPPDLFNTHHYYLSFRCAYTAG